MPLSQSMISDLVPPAKRGAAFGRLAMMGNAGGLLGGLMSTSLSEAVLLPELWGGFRGWRVSFVLVRRRAPRPASAATLPVAAATIDHGRRWQWSRSRWSR